MKAIPSFLRLLATVAIGCTFAAAATADEVKVLAASAFQPVLASVAPLFAQRSGHTLALAKEGEEFDLAVLPQSPLEALGREGAVSEGSIIPLARGRGPRAEAPVYAGAVSTSAANSQAALSLLILLASEDTQAVLQASGLSAP